MKLLWYVVSVNEQEKHKYPDDCIVMMYVHQIQICCCSMNPQDYYRHLLINIQVFLDLQR
jgi:hypothetical protein